MSDLFLFAHALTLMYLSTKIPIDFDAAVCMAAMFASFPRILDRKYSPEFSVKYSLILSLTCYTISYMLIGQNK
jgi:hypothetical protein